MASPRFAWGIDIGNRALKAVRLVSEGGALRVDDFEFVEHETLLSQAGDNREQLIEAALGNLVQRHQFKGGVVAISVSGQNSFSRFVKLPPVEDKKIPEIVRFEAIQQIPFPLDDVEWSYQLFREKDNPEVEVGIFAMRKELVNQQIKAFTDFDLNVQSVQMSPLAVYNAMAYDGRFNDGTAMVIDVGTENTDLLIADNNSIWTRSIPIGGSNFTEALVKAFKINFVKAEELKRNAQTSKYARQIFQHMRPVFSELVNEVQRSIGFYSSVHREGKIGKIYCLGGTFKLPGLQKYLQQNLQLPVERIDSLAAGAPGDSKQSAAFGDNLLSVVGAYGLAIQAMNQAPVTSSLLPAHIQRERMWQEKTKWFGLAAGLFIAGTTIAGARFFFEDLQYNAAAPIRTENAQVLSKVKTLSADWMTVQNSGERERTIIANLETLRRGKYLWRDILVGVVNVLPQPTGQLKAAIDSGNAEAIKKVPRTERQIVKVDELVPTYMPTMMTVIAAPSYRPPTIGTSGGGIAPSPMMSMGGETGVVAPPPPDGKGRGYIINIKLTTPLSPGQEAIGRGVPSPDAFFDGAVQKALLTLAPSKNNPNMTFAVRKFWILQRSMLASNLPRLERLNADYTAAMSLKKGEIIQAPPGGGGQPTRPPGGGFSGFSGSDGGFNPEGMGNGANGIDATAGPVRDSDNPAYKDRLTDESMLTDYEFEIAIAVEIFPEPWQAPTATPGSATANAGTP